MEARIVDWPHRAKPKDRLGRPLHDLRISVMDRCNFRCPYCMPRETFHEHYRFLKSSERLSFEEITRQNMAMMERAFSMFNPFGFGEDKEKKKK